MKCVIGKNGATWPGHASVTLQRGGTTVLIKDVPASVCENCGECYLSETVSGQVLAQAEETVHRGTEIEVVPFAA